MDKISTIKKNILYFIENQSIKKEDFYKNTGISASNFKGVGLKSEMSSDKIAKILSIYPFIDSNWLLTGKGQMLNYHITDNLVSEPPEGYHVNRKTEGIPLIPIEAMAGFGGGDRQVLEYECEFFSIPTFKGADFLIQVKGSSMYPTYSSGDIVACKKLVRDDVFFQWNKVYVIDTEQGALIKRIAEGKDQDHVMIVSDNEKYQPFNLPKYKIHAISIVMGVIRLE